MTSIAIQTIMRHHASLIYLGILLTTLAQTSGQIRVDSQTDRQIHSLETELTKIRLLHNKGKEKMRELEREISYYQTGLDVLCRTLQLHKTIYQPLDPVTTPLRAIRPTVSGITAHSVDTIISRLGDTSVVQLSVRYSTTETHEVIWAYNVLGHMIKVHESDPYSSVRTEKSGENFTTHLYIAAADLNKIELLYLKILSEYSEITLLFNKEAVLAGERAHLSPMTLRSEDPKPEMMLISPEDDAIIVTYIDTNINKITTFVNFIGIDTSTDPDYLLDLQLSDRRIKSDLINTTSGFKWIVTLDKSLVKVGGMVSLRTVEQKMSGAVLQIHVGKTMYVVQDVHGLAKVPFQEGSVAILPLYRNTGYTIIAKKPVGAIWCYAFGNPAPVTTIQKLDMNGQKRPISGHVFNIGQYDSAQIVLLQNISKSDEGRYLCEARSGTNVVTEPLFVQVI